MAVNPPRQWWHPWWGLRAKLALILVIPAALIVSVLIVLFQQNLRHAFNQRQVEEGLLFTAKVERLLTASGQFPETGTVEAILQSALHENPLYVQISLYGPDGRLVAVASTGVLVRPVQVASQETMQVFESRMGVFATSQIEVAGRLEKVLKVVSPVFVGATASAVLESYRSVGDSQLLIDELMKRVVVIGPIGIGFLVVLVFLGMNYFVIRPLQRLQHATAEIARGRYDMTLPMTGHDEVARLAGSFNQMATSIAESIKKEQQQIHQLSMLTAAAYQMVVEQDPVRLQDHLVKAVRQLVPSEFSALYIMDPATKQIARFSHDGVDLSKYPLSGQPTGSGLLGCVLREGAALRLSDIATDSRSVGLPDGHMLIRSFLSVPMKLGDGTVIGGISVANRADARDYTVVDESLLTTIANQAATAFHRLHLFDEVHRQSVELEKKNQDLEAFVYTVSHDLKTPVISLQGLASVLLEEHRSSLNEDGQHYLDRIIANGNKMEELIQGLLELSRIGLRSGSFEEIELHMAVIEAKESLREILERNHAEVVIADHLPTVTMNRFLLSQLLTNLISNAVKYRKEDVAPRVEIGGRLDEASVEFFVRDYGIGIDPEYHEKVFGIFTRLCEREGVEGTGVGLAIVKKIVELAKGRIWVESTVGEGSTFLVRLPSRLPARASDQTGDGWGAVTNSHLSSGCPVPHEVKASGDNER